MKLNTLITLSTASIGIVSSFVASTAYADTDKGQKWLMSQSQSPSSAIAHSLQTEQEMSQTLKLLQSQIKSTDLTSALTVESSTEGLVRLALLAYHQEKTLHPAWQKLTDNQNIDGGFGHMSDWQSNPLDTAFVLIALSETNYLSDLDATTLKLWQSRINKALSYLATQQHQDGAYKISHLDNLYTSSYVLSAFTPYIKNQGQYISSVQNLVNYLGSRQTAPATWSTQESEKGLFLDALVAESLYPYQDSNHQAAFRTNFNNRVLALQAENGSWQGDVYVTSLVLRALNKLSQPVVNPITSAISLSTLDTETLLPLSGVALTASSANSAQDINIISDSDGSIIIQNVAAGDYTFTLSKEGYASAQFALRLRKGEQVNLGQVKLSRASAIANGQIQGTVTDKLSNSLIANAMVTLVLVDADGKKLSNFEPIVTKTNSQGAYQITLTKEQQEVSKGRFGIDIRAENYLAVQGSGIAPAGGVTLFSPQLIITSQPQAVLVAQAIDDNGNPLAGVVFTNEDSKQTATTDASGKISINSLEAGTQIWRLSKEGYQNTSFSFVVEDAATYDVGIITVKKTVLSDPNDPSSEPLPDLTGNFTIAPIDATTKQSIQGFKVVAERLDNNQVVQTQSFVPSDNLNIANKLDLQLPVGRWRLTISHPAYRSSSQTFDLNNDSTLDYAPSLVINPYAVSGSVVDSQTNNPIADAPVVVFNNDTDQKIYTGKTDSGGRFTLPSNLSATNVRVEISPALYLPTTRHINRQADFTTNVDMGEIRLRPKSADVVLPDLALASIDSTSLSTDQQRLITTGTLKAVIENKGNADLLNTDVSVIAFIDANNNRQFDEGEQIVGKLKTKMFLTQGATEAIDIMINAKVNFRDAPIAVMVDSEQQIAEKSEDNNVRLTSDGVEIKPPVGTLEAEVAWSGGYGNDSGAIAAPLEDTNGDGVIGKGDIASIIVYRGGLYNVLDGKTGQFKFSIQGAGSQELAAVGDVDGDGLPEIVVTAHDGIRIYSNQGVLKKVLPAQLNFSGWSSDAYHPIIADLDQDGIPEIIQNNKIFTYADGLIKDNLPSGQSQAVADVNGDGFLDIIGLSGVADRQGNELYKFTDINNRNIVLKFLAVGDVLGAKTPQIVAVYGSYVMVIDAKTGKTIGQYTAPSSAGGPPVIADFDGDGISDIGLARTYNYVAMRGDGSVIWNTPISDGSGGTGSTVFDFDNDGKTEAVHFDERFLRIYDAATGVERIKIPNNTATAHEYPIVGDFDGDGHADILITSTGNGTRMISSKNKDWADTRNIWNQYSYHVTNINDDLSVPKIEPNSWDIHNTYRANLIPGVNVTAAADITASYLQIKDNGSSAASRFTARIGNAGGKPVSKGTPISFYRLPKGANDGQAQLIGKVTLTDSLAADSYVDISIDYTPEGGSLADFGELIVIANDAGAGIESATGLPNPVNPTDPAYDHGVIQEYTRSNNMARIAVTGNFTAFSLAGSTNKTAYTANDKVTITASPTNLGSFPTSPSIRVSIVDSAGNLIHQFNDNPVDLNVALTNIGNPPVNSANILNTWNTQQSPTGNYKARIELIYQDKIVAAVDKDFAIVADVELSAQTNSQLSVNKTQYLPTDLVQVHSRLINTASNAMAGQREVTLTATDPSGKLIWTQSYSHHELAPNAIKDQHFSIPLINAVAGDYLITSATTASDGNQAEQILTQSFHVLSAAQSGFGVSGTLTGAAEIEVGDTVNWQWTINNSSKEQLKDVPLSIALFKENDPKPFKTLALSSVNIGAGNTISGSLPWASFGTDGERITAVLLATFSQEVKGLAQAQVLLTQPPIHVTIDNREQLGDTLLIYYDCVPGWQANNQTSKYGNHYGGYKESCLDERAAVLTPYLDRINIPYKLVATPDQFTNEMQSGKYAQYWLLGSTRPLYYHAQQELIELAYSGDNLLIDSAMNGSANHELYSLAGVKSQGILNIGSNMLALIDQFVTPPSDNVIANAKLSVTTQYKNKPNNGHWVQRFFLTDPTKAQVWATVSSQYNGGNHYQGNFNPSQSTDYPAIVSQRYGNGMPIATSFDVITSLDLATSANIAPYPDSQSHVNAQELHWDSILQKILTSRRQTIKADYVPNEVIRLPITFKNTSNIDKRILISVDLPTGSQWLGYKGGVDDVIKNDKVVNYQIALKANQSISDVITIRLPSTAGAHPVRLTASDITNGSQNAAIMEQFEARYLVRDIDARLNLIQEYLSHWQTNSQNTGGNANIATKLKIIKMHRNNNNHQLALQEVARLGDTLSRLQTRDHSAELRQLRFELDELLRALQIEWYLARS